MDVGGNRENASDEEGARFLAVLALSMGVGACMGFMARSRKRLVDSLVGDSRQKESSESLASGTDREAPGGSSKAASQQAARSTESAHRQQGAVGASLPRPIQVLGALLAPPTAAVGLVLYLATRRQETLLLYFGIDPSLLNYTLEDYLLRSADVLAVVLLPLLALAIIAIAGHSWVQQRTATGRDVSALFWGSLVLRSAGVVILVTATVSLVGLWRALPAHAISPSIAVGAALAGYGGVVQRRLRPGGGHEQSWVPLARGVLYFALIFIGVFLTTEDIAEALGRGRAELIGGALYQQRPGVVLYSDSRLFISGPGVTESQLGPTGLGGYSYRYDGLRLLVRSGDRLVLLPSGWTSEEGLASIVRDDSAIRVEMFPPGR